MYMMYVMHHAFRRDLAAFAAAVPRTPVDDRADLAGPGRPLGALRRGAAPPPQPARTPGCGRALLERADDGGARDAARRWRPSTRRSTRCSRPAPPGSPGWRPAPTRTPAPRSPYAWSRRARASAGTCATRRPRRSDHPGAFVPADWEELDEKFREEHHLRARWSRWCRGRSARSRRRRCRTCSPAPGGAHRLIWRLTRAGSRRRRGPGVPLRPGRLRSDGQKPKRSRWLAQPLRRPAGRPTPRTAARRRRRAGWRAGPSPAAAAASARNASTGPEALPGAGDAASSRRTARAWRRCAPRGRASPR